MGLQRGAAGSLGEPPVQNLPAGLPILFGWASVWRRVPSIYGLQATGDSSGDGPTRWFRTRFPERCHDLVERRVPMGKMCPYLR